MNTLLQLALFIGVLVFFSMWGVAVWSQRKRILRLWVAGVLGGVVFVPSSIALGCLFVGTIKPTSECGMVMLLALYPSVLGVPTMLVVMVMLTLATLFHRHRAKTCLGLI